MIKLSIIIPYYYTYKYTIQLLKELSIQVTDEVEVILVDDGCNETRFDEFKFVNVIHLDKNYGASHAWNVGLDVAQGQFIGFIDSDDMIMMDYIEVLLDAIKHDYADEIIFSFINIVTSNVQLRPQCRAIWKAIYRRNIVPRFDESFVCNTDAPFKRKLDATEHTQYYLERVLYCYRSEREGSITWRKNKGMLSNNIDKEDDICGKG